MFKREWEKVEYNTLPTMHDLLIIDRLQSNHSNFPSGILVLPTDDGRLPRILVPKSVQSSLVLQAHLDILVTLAGTR